MGTAITCTDSDPCTLDACDAVSGCTFATPALCDDGNACTADTCTSKVGCVFSVASAACSDGMACTTDACVDGICVGTPTGCSDGNVCTLDSCNPATGNCIHKAGPDGDACDADGSICTADVCKGGTCKVGTKMSCDDGNSCTTDGCDAIGGCTHVALNDGSGCPKGVCASGVCALCLPGTLRIPFDDAGVAKVVCAFDYPAWGLDALTPTNLTDNGDATVSDDLTGLMWTQNLGVDVKEDDSPAYCDSLVVAGHSDWRLPTVAEGMSIVDYDEPFGPMFSPTFFGDVPKTGIGWTAVEDDQGYMRWWVNLEDGGTKIWPYDAGQVRCVRTLKGVTPPPARYTISKSGLTVLDNATGRTWQRAVAATMYKPAAALAACANLTLDGLSMWHLPNVRELASIVDRTNFANGEIDTAVFPDSPVEWFWTSTPHGSDGQYYVHFQTPFWNDYGNMRVENVQNEHVIRCVHD